MFDDLMACVALILVLSFFLSVRNKIRSELRARRHFRQLLQKYQQHHAQDEPVSAGGPMPSYKPETTSYWH